MSAKDPLDGTWWRIEPQFADPSDLAGLTLQAGTFRAGTTAEVSHALPHLGSQAMRGGLPFAFGPLPEGDVGYGFWTGRKSEIRALSPDSGVDRLLVDSLDVVNSAIFDPTTRNLYYLTLDPLDRLKVSLLSKPLAGGAPVTVAVLPAEPDGDQIDLRLVASPDGRWLVVIDCRLQCSALGYPSDLRSPDPASRPAWTVSLDGHDVTGISNDLFFAAQACDGPCAITTVDLRSGEEVGGLRFCTAALAVPNGLGAPVIVSDGTDERTCREPDYRVYSWDDLAGTFTPRQLAQFGTQSRTLVNPRGSSGYGLPPGWFLLGPRGELLEQGQQRLGPVLINVDSGVAIESKPLGD